MSEFATAHDIVELEQCNHRFHRGCLCIYPQTFSANQCPKCKVRLFLTAKDMRKDLSEARRELRHANEKVRDLTSWFVRNEGKLRQMTTAEIEDMKKTLNEQEKYEIQAFCNEAKSDDVEELRI